MIITKLQGGLGNTMFQYAYGRMLALRNNTELKLDISLFDNYEYHSYSLNNLNIKERIASKKELAQFLKYKPRTGRIGRRLNRFFVDEKKYVVEPRFTFCPEMMDVKAPCEVDGYWQSEKYFLEIEPLLRKEFTLRNLLGPYSLEMAEKIRTAEAPVMLHVRRGDFVSIERFNKILGTSSMEYYAAATATINERIKNPTYFVFSDDIAWARENIRTGFPTEFVGQGPDKNYEDLELMRLCHHHILANSTFGWWGSWLSDHYRTGITIAPKHWNAKIDSVDLLPSHWIVLSL